MTKLEELKAMVSVLQKKIEALEKPKQWEPKGGDWWVDTSGIAREYESSPCTIKFGVERQTAEAAEKASAAMRTHNRLLAYVDEFGGDWEADWENRSQEKCCVNYSYSVNDRVWEWNNNYSVRTSGAVYMSRDCAKDLVAKLNSGEVVL